MNEKKVAAVLLVVVLILAVSPVSVLAKGKPPTESTNNLSVPTIMIGGGFTNITCSGNDDLVMPTGEPSTGFEVPGFYYVQGVHKWQADCITADSAIATAEWGDNLSGDAKLKVGSPIRVELGLFNADQNVPEMSGFNVIKLEPSKLDRESKYGTLATFDEVGEIYNATAEPLPARVYDAQVTFSIKNVATGVYAVPEGSNPTAEINATGKVVYGYNLRVSAAGEYEITFVIPNVDITGVDAGDYTCQDELSNPIPCEVSLTINVIAGGGGGKK